MIYGVGIDLVNVSRIERNLNRFSDDFAKKILHEQEFQEFQNKKNKRAFLSKRFAAKEAFLKALGTGLAKGISLKHIEITHDECGKPIIRCYEKALELIEKNNIKTIHLSISDEQEHAAAIVILEK